MSSLACVPAEVNESTGSAFRIAFQQYADRAGFFRPVAVHLQVKMKAVRLQRDPEGPDPGGLHLARLPAHQRHQPPHGAGPGGRPGVGHGALPRQSQINLFLNRMTAENLAQLEQAHQDLLRSHSLLRSALRVVADFRGHQAGCRPHTRDGGKNHPGASLPGPARRRAPARTACRWRARQGVARGPQPNGCAAPTALLTFVEKVGN